MTKMLFALILCVVALLFDTAAFSHNSSHPVNNLNCLPISLVQNIDVSKCIHVSTTTTYYCPIVTNKIGYRVVVYFIMTKVKNETDVLKDILGKVTSIDPVTNNPNSICSYRLKIPRNLGLVSVSVQSSMQDPIQNTF